MKTEHKMATDTNEKNDASLHIGQKFSTYDEVEKVIAQRCRLFSEKWYLDSGGRTIKQANANINNPSLHYKAAFKYALVNLKCIHGGRFKPKGVKRNRQSLLLDCPAKITLSARRKEDHLVITKLNLEHNHELIPESCGYYHVDRKPTEAQRDEITKLVKLGLPAKKIVKHMSDTTGKVFRRYDIHNVSKKIKKPPETAEKEIWTILKKMCQDDCSSQYFVREDDAKDLSTLFFQTGAMRRIIREYGDVIFVYGSFSLNSHGYSVYVFMCVDGENKGHVVCYCFVRDETKASPGDVFTDFISHNDVEVKTVVVDKDTVGIAAVGEAMPGANVLFSKFHVAHAFRAATTKYCSVPEREKSRDLLMTMLNCFSEEEFNTAYDMLPCRIKIYVDKEWTNNKESWAQHLTKHVLSWGSETTNHFECHKKILKTLSSNTKSLSAIIEKILTYHQTEEQNLALTDADAILKTRVHHSSIPSNQLEHCSSFLSHAACDLIVGQMEKLFLSKDFTVEVEGEIVYVKKDETENEVNVVTSGDECSCCFFLRYHLPCWHLMACYLVNGQPLVNKESVPKRWLKSTLLAAFTEQVSEDTSAVVLASDYQENDGKVLNDVQKREEASKLCDDLTNAMASCGQESFNIRCKVLQSLLESWNDGRDVPDGMILVKDEGEQSVQTIVQGQTDYSVAVEGTLGEIVASEMKADVVNSYVVQITDIGEPVPDGMATVSGVSNDLLCAGADPNTTVINFLHSDYNNINLEVEAKDVPAGLDFMHNAVVATVTDHAYLAPQKIVISDPKSGI